MNEPDPDARARGGDLPTLAKKWQRDAVGSAVRGRWLRWTIVACLALGLLFWRNIKDAILYEADPPFPAHVMIAVSRRCFDGSRSFDLRIAPDGTATLSSHGGEREARSVPPATIAHMLDAFEKHGFRSMRRHYDSEGYTHGTLVYLMLNSGSLQKRVDAYSSDSDSGEVFAIMAEIDRSLGLGEWLTEIRERESLAPESRD